MRRASGADNARLCAARCSFHIRFSAGRLGSRGRYQLTIKMHMATVIERPVSSRASEDRTVYMDDSSEADNSVGWALALIALAVLALIAMFAWPGLVRRAAPAASPSTIQVNVPSGGSAAPAASTPAPVQAPVQQAPVQSPAQNALPVDNGAQAPVAP